MKELENELRIAILLLATVFCVSCAAPEKDAFEEKCGTEAVQVYSPPIGDTPGEMIRTEVMNECNHEQGRRLSKKTKSPENKSGSMCEKFSLQDPHYSDEDRKIIEKKFFLGGEINGRIFKSVYFPKAYLNENAKSELSILFNLDYATGLPIERQLHKDFMTKDESGIAIHILPFGFTIEKQLSFTDPKNMRRFLDQLGNKNKENNTDFSTHNSLGNFKYTGKKLFGYDELQWIGPSNNVAYNLKFGILKENGKITELLMCQKNTEDDSFCKIEFHTGFLKIEVTFEQPLLSNLDQIRSVSRQFVECISEDVE